MTARHDLYSYIEVCGKIQTHSTNQEAHEKPYYYMKLAFRDGGSGPKLMNVFVWDEALKNEMFNIQPQNGDVVKVRGDIGYQEKDSTPFHSIRASHVEIVRRNPHTAPKEETRAGFNF